MGKSFGILLELNIKFCVHVQLKNTRYETNKIIDELRFTYERICMRRNMFFKNKRVNHMKDVHPQTKDKKHMKIFRYFLVTLRLKKMFT